MELIIEAKRKRSASSKRISYCTNDYTPSCNGDTSRNEENASIEISEKKIISFCGSYDQQGAPWTIEPNRKVVGCDISDTVGCGARGCGLEDTVG